MTAVPMVQLAVTEVETCTTLDWLAALAGLSNSRPRDSPANRNTRLLRAMKCCPNFRFSPRIQPGSPFLECAQQLGPAIPSRAASHYQTSRWTSDGRLRSD